jgi:hypothetical protein
MKKNNFNKIKPVFVFVFFGNFFSFLSSSLLSSVELLDDFFFFLSSSLSSSVEVLIAATS